MRIVSVQNYRFERSNMFCCCITLSDSTSVIGYYDADPDMNPIEASGMAFQHARLKAEAKLEITCSY